MSFDRHTLRMLTETSGLSIPEDRVPVVMALAGSIHDMLGSLREVDLGETAPASAFSPEWAE